MTQWLRRHFPVIRSANVFAAIVLAIISLATLSFVALVWFIEAAISPDLAVAVAVAGGALLIVYSWRSP